MGSVDILIGTHRILSKDIKFKDLGLLIIDEEQRFGVSAKEKLRSLRVSVDTLTLTATPIPRTLNFSLLGARDLSVIETAPRNRVPTVTEVIRWDEEAIAGAMHEELKRGGQATDRCSIALKCDDLLTVLLRVPNMLFSHLSSGSEHNLQGVRHIGATSIVDLGGRVVFRTESRSFSIAGLPTGAYHGEISVGHSEGP